MKVLFVNHKVKNCGVYQYGWHLFQILSRSKDIEYIYRELDCSQDYLSFLRNNPEISHGIYNWCRATLPWLENCISKTIKNIAIVHEEPPQDFFDLCCRAATPTDAFSIPRPIIEDVESTLKNYSPSGTIKDFIMYKEEGVPIFGSFGFGGLNKGFQDIVSLVNQQFDNAIIKLVITLGEFVNDAKNTADIVIQECRKNNRKNGVKLMITTEFFSEEDILYFLRSNTMNMFMYWEIGVISTSSVLDYALAVKKPFGITRSNRFYLFYERDVSLTENSIKHCMEHSLPVLEKLLKRYSGDKTRDFFRRILVPTPSTETIKYFIEYKEENTPSFCFVEKDNFERQVDLIVSQYDKALIKIVMDIEDETKKQKAIETCYKRIVKPGIKLLMTSEKFAKTDIMLFDKSLLPKKLLICIAFHYMEENVKHLRKVLNNIFDNYKYATHVIIDTNTPKTSEILLPLYPSLQIVVHENLAHPFYLTWMHRGHIQKNLNNYDLVMYSEDDILVPFHCIIDFWDKIKTMWPKYIPCYRCVEWSKKQQKYVVLGVVNKQKVDQTNTVVHDGKKYVIPSRPHHAFWMLPTSCLKEVITPSFTEVSVCREHAASYVLGPPPYHFYDETYTGDKFLNKIPLFEIENGRLSKNCIVYHTPDKYADIEPNIIPVEEYLV